MSKLKSCSHQLLMLAAVACLVAASAILARAVDSKNEAGAAPPGKSRAETAKSSTQKRFSFEMRDKPWGSVLEWLSDQSGLPYSGNRPTGTFTFVAPNDKGKRYTLSEIIDILNDALVKQQYLLVRGEWSLYLVPADEKVDSARVPRIQPQDLDQRGNTELVSTVLPLNSLPVKDVLADVKKMMGPYGEALALAPGNQLLLQDTAGNLKRIVRTIQEIQDKEDDSRSIETYVCKYVDARNAAKLLNDLLDDTPTSSIPGDRLQGLRAVGAPPRSPRRYSVAVDERSNSVFIQGTANKIAQARQVLKAIDVPASNPILADSPMFKTIHVASGSASTVARILQEIHKANPDVRISAVNDKTILIYAGPDKQLQIAGQLKNLQDDLIPPAATRSERQGAATGNRTATERGGLFDLYLKSGRFAENVPSLAGVRFDGYESFGEKKFMRFHKESDQVEVYLIDPAEIVALRSRRAGTPARGARGGPVFGGVGRGGAAFGGFGGGAAFGGFGGGAAGVGPFGRAGAARGGPVEQKLDTILQELRKLESRLSETEKSKGQGGQPKKP
jgi:type II secretory pathway component GspD/PulD (secretin)